MMRGNRSVGLIALMLLVVAPVALGQDGEPDAVAEQLEKMQEQINTLQADNTALRDTVDELRAQSGDDWLTERRAEEIRGLVQDVLADADTRTSLQSSGFTAGHDGRFFLASADGRFRLAVDGQIQARYTYNYVEEFTNVDRHREGFSVPRATLAFRGHVFSEDIQYLVRLNVANEVTGINGNGLYFLEDAWMRFVLSDDFSFRVGQFKLPFLREELVSSKYQLAVDRSIVEEKQTIGRSQGIEMTYLDDANRFMFAFSDAPQETVFIESLTGWTPIVGGPTPGGGPSPLTKDTDFTFSGRYERKLAGTWRQFQDFTGKPSDDFGMLLGVAGFWAAGEWGEDPPFPNSGEKDEAQFLGVTVDLSMEWGGANFFTAFTWEYLDTGAAGFRGDNFETNANIFGWVVQGGIYFTPKWEMFGRYEWSTWDPDRPFAAQTFSAGNLSVITAGLNYYIEGHDVKWTTDVGVGLQPISIFYDAPVAGYRPQAGTGPEVVVRSQIQLLF